MGKLHEILSVFQEGVIEEMSLIDKDLNFKMECKYLAEQINSKYSFFYGVIKGVDDFYFVPWEDEFYAIRRIEDIVQLKPDILSVDEEDGYIKIYSNCKEVYSGGNFFISAKAIKIFDEDLLELNKEDLMELSDKYWYSSRRAE